MEDDFVEEGEDDEEYFGGGKAALTHRFGNNGGIPSPTAPPKLPLGEATSISSSSQERELLPTNVEGGVDTNTTETSHLYSSTPRRKGGNSARARYGNGADERRPPHFYQSGHKRSIRNNNNENPNNRGGNIFSRFFRFLFGFGGNSGVNDNYYRNQRLPILATPFTNPTGPAGNYYGRAAVKEV
uniref:Uncharacterized protein n=1 Tax=Meloidogyne hapla TaxID=6305 RepID=A0A1I8AWV1_MELHA